MALPCGLLSARGGEGEKNRAGSRRPGPGRGEEACGVADRLQAAPATRRAVYGAAGAASSASAPRDLAG